MIQADPPPPASPPPAEVVVARSNHTTVAASLDLPLSLTKAGRHEAMIVRRVLFLNVVVNQVLPAGAPDSGASDRYRWTLTSFLEREYCVRSVTGVLACTTPETAPLPDKGDGEAPLTSPGDFSLAVRAEGLLSSTLAGRSDEIFEADRKAAVDPFLRAAGVTLARAARRR
jgi:hypothetical protein